MGAWEWWVSIHLVWPWMLCGWKKMKITRICICKIYLDSSWKATPKLQSWRETNYTPKLYHRWKCTLSLEKKEYKIHEITVPFKRYSLIKSSVVTLAETPLPLYLIAPLSRLYSFILFLINYALYSTKLIVQNNSLQPLWPAVCRQISFRIIAHNSLSGEKRRRYSQCRRAPNRAEELVIIRGNYSNSSGARACITAIKLSRPIAPAFHYDDNNSQSWWAGRDSRVDRA